MEKRTRRLGHKKSRNGCQRCKARRVKCDEERPCRKCVAHGAHCSLVDQPATSLSTSTSTSPLTAPPQPPPQPPHAPTAPPKPAAPRQFVPIRPAAEGAHEAASEAGLTPTAVRSSASPYPGDPARDPRIDPAADPGDLSENWLQSLRLMHHYNTSTCHVLTNDRCTEELWKTAVPEMACSHKFLMHGLLALSAMHYASLHPHEQKKWDIISVHHQNLALRSFALRLNDINKDNCEAYFFLATLIFILSIYSVAHGTRLGRAVSLDNVSQCFMLLHGIKGIIEFQPIEEWRQRGGPLDTILRAAEVPPGGSWSSSPFQKRLDAVTVLAREVRASFAEVINPQSVCVLALESLRRTHQICKSADDELDGVDKSGAAWAWAANLPPLFIEMIDNRHPTALVILAHYAALARLFEQASNWLFYGWSDTVMSLLDEALDDEWRPWIQWPKRSLTERIDVDDMEV
ncbi:fungal Zn binuclear cluster domain-containing protein [Colletotrichum tabaci]|uniref:Fungal Zn binuclear cluster domain-containing protein n=1 Tax=Colletotrichum tabaci TaxID=1209068 RepID=A0AAV9TKM2_9PEZI